MKIEEYADAALRTDAENYDQFTSRLISEARAAHAVLGLSSELIEFKDALFKYKNPLLGLHSPNLRKEAIKELGDLCWFTNLLCHHFSLDIVELHAAGVNSVQSEMDVSVEYLTSAVKARIFYDRPYKMDDVVFHLGRLVGALVRNSERYFDISFEDVLQVNIDKLKAHYPQKFCEKAANNRADEKE